MKTSSGSFTQMPAEGEKKVLNSELWHACAGPLVSLPPVRSNVVYFPQGHSEQVAASTHKEVDTHILNYPNVPPQLICWLHDLTMHADVETDEVYAQMILQPLTLNAQRDACLLPAELCTVSQQPTNYFCKTLTESDISTHRGFSVPRRVAEKVFPPLDYTQQPPAQELIARDLHENEWKFRHIFRGQPKRHRLTTGWSAFVSAKRLVAGDAVIFIRNEKNQLFLGIRRANGPQAIMPSSVLSSDSTHIGLLAAAAHAAASKTRFTIFFIPRDSPSEFVVPVAKYAKAVYHTHIAVGMRFQMLFETEDSSVRRYKGTITGISDLDPVRWSNSHWRSVKVGWDESTAVERQPRVSLWEIELRTTFPVYPSPFPLRLKRPWPSGLSSFSGMKDCLNSSLMWLQKEVGECCMPFLNFLGYGLTPWNQPRLDPAKLDLQPDIYQTMASSALQDPRSLEKRQNQSLQQFLQNQNMSYQPATALIQKQLLQQAQSQQNLVQNFQDTQTVSQNQVQDQILQQQLQSCHPYDAAQRQQQQQQQQKQQLPQFEQLHVQFSDQEQIQKAITTTSSIGFSAQSQPTSFGAITSACPQQRFSNSTTNLVAVADISPMYSLLNSFSQDGGSRHCTLSDSSPLISNSPLLSKRVAIEPQLSSATVQCSLPQVQESGGQQTRRSLGVNVQQNELSNIRNNDNEYVSLSIPFACSSFPIATGPDFPPGSDATTASLVDKSRFLQPSENEDQINSPSGTFVKVILSMMMVVLALWLLTSFCPNWVNMVLP